MIVREYMQCNKKNDIKVTTQFLIEKASFSFTQTKKISLFVKDFPSHYLFNAKINRYRNCYKMMS